MARSRGRTHTEARSARLEIAENTPLTPLFSESPIGVLILDGMGRIKDVNPVGCGAFARPLERLCGTLLLDWVLPADRTKTEDRIQEVVEGKVTEWDTSIRRGDGLPRIQRLRAIPLRRGGVVGGILVFLRGASEPEAGRPERNQLQRFMENLPGQFLLTTDKAGKIRFSSGLGRTHFWDNSTVLGQHYRVLVGGERDGGQTLDELLREVCAGNPWAGMQWHSREDGQRFPVEVFGSPHRDPETGRIVGALIVGRDISTQQRWRDQAEISEPLAQIGQLSSRIAREMDAGLGRLEDLTLSPSTDGDRPGIDTSAVRSQLERTRRLLARVLEVLLENALDALEGTAKRHLEIELKDSADGVVWRITNSGSEVREESLSQLFDPFYTTREGHVGLGLAVAHRMVRAHQGRIWAEIPDAGFLTVSVELPREAPDRVRSFRPVPLNVSRPRTVLVVDDDEGHRAGLRAFLEKVGFEVAEAWSGRSAMAQVTSGHLPEMVITDLKMADGSGFWFLEELEQEFPRLVRKTVVLSGNADHEAAVRLSEDTGCPVIRKPFDAGQLLDILDQVAVEA